MRDSMDILEAKCELKKMRVENLLKMVMDQKLSKCLVGGINCGHSLLYKEIRFCVSEVLGKGCLVERLGQWEKYYPEKGINKFSPPLLPILGAEPLSPDKKIGEFKVYYKDDMTHSMIYLGTVIERRKKERGNNLRDLLKKATKEYSNYLPDPSKIFLLG
jgi:hypothetical protein